MTYRSDGIEAVVAQGMTEYLAELLRAGEDPSRSPKSGANEANPPSPQAAPGQAPEPPSPPDDDAGRTQRLSA